MKNCKGITMISLVIYVIGITIVIGIISVLTSYFYKNINTEEITQDISMQYQKFTSEFSKEVNIENNNIIDCKANYIIFSSGNQYTYNSENKSVYKNNIRICEKIEQCIFSYFVKDGKITINVEIQTSNINMTGENALTYTLNM